MPWKECSVMDERLRFVARLLEGEPMTDVCRATRRHSVEPEIGEIEHLDERVDYANRIALVDPVIEAFGQQCRLPAFRPNHEALHKTPPQIAR